MYKIKQIPEDFIVKEKMNLQIGSGKYSYYKLKKTGYTTQKAVSIIAKRLKIRKKFVNFSGNKDRSAVTEQYVSVLNGPKITLDLKDITLEFIGRGNTRINLGTHYANEFEIVVRNISSMPKPLEQFPNYFDDQRFGMNKNNHIIGKLIIQKRFKEATDLLPETHEHLKKYPKDYVGALSAIPKRILWLFCHSYQSYLWNIMSNNYLKKFKHKTISYSLGSLTVSLERVC